MTSHNKKVITFGLFVSVITFILLLVGIKYVLNNDVTSKNIVAFIILAFIYGSIAATFYYFKLRYAYSIFIVGITIGFIEMYRMFNDGMNGWGDLTGLMSLFMWAAMGMFVGLLIQLIVYGYNKYKYKDKS